MNTHANQPNDNARVLDCSVDDDDDTCPNGKIHLNSSLQHSLTYIFTEYLPGDELRHICRVAIVLAEHKNLDEEPISSPATYRVNWRRHAIHIVPPRILKTTNINQSSRWRGKRSHIYDHSFIATSSPSCRRIGRPTHGSSNRNTAYPNIPHPGNS